jgi:UV DNA damage endonuclease
MAKRKRSSGLGATLLSPASVPTDAARVASTMMPPTLVRRASTRTSSPPKPANIDSNPNTNRRIVDGQQALRASPDAEGSTETFEAERVTARKGKKAAAPTTPKPSARASPSESPSSNLTYIEEPPSRAPSTKSTPVKKKVASKPAEIHDPEAEEDEEDANPEEISAALSRPPPVNSSYLPLPWKGRLGYACLCTYLRFSSPPVFSSRTCRIASILEHRHPLKDPSQPEHATKNRPDKDQPADIARGQAYVEALGLANARDIPRMLRWNHKYGIKFLRLSSEMFPFASHDIYGYRLAPFASDALAEAGKVAAELGHRLTTHPGQFTQLGSPRKEVIVASIKDLQYHCELLSLLKLPPQQNRDAVMILHMGGIFGDKVATLNRFRENYAALSQPIKGRLVLENDDVCYSVHDLLPICEELNIPLVLDYHHHNIIFDANKIREGTKDIMDLYDRIKATWTRKGITQKMHYSEPTPGAITGRQRRKHNPRVATLPPCPPDMDLMIEAKDKEQAVFELMKTFKLPGYDTFNDILPYQRTDENKAWKPPKKKTPRKKKGQEIEDIEPEEELVPPPIVPDEEVGMGGPEGRVYWPPGMEEWLRPKKKEVKKRDPAAMITTAEKAAARRADKAKWQADTEAAAAAVAIGGSVEPKTVPIKIEANTLDVSEMPVLKRAAAAAVNASKRVPSNKAAAPKKPSKKPKTAKRMLTPSTSDGDEDVDLEGGEDEEMSDLSEGREIAVPVVKKRPVPVSRRQSRRSLKKAVVYNDGIDEDDDEI